ncbi:SH3 domain-containing protein [Clostridium intestinale]|uniref:SH3 domain-containing protein n=1 Tax=Clostridium intestinale DSM 6191 TaxID=1121320 RepID=A0A1M6DQB7_9CLOT|nr:SH3 domain-containing protein [Clostridium intestinale]SHI75380.1 SH3 domain-containing protein [Clostridium intestinale DSM 6191]
MKNKLLKVVVTNLSLIIFTSIFGYEVNALEINPDINGDNIINEEDLNELSKYYNTNREQFDFNKDGIVDIYDFTIISKYINSDLYKTYNSSGVLIQSFKVGEIDKAIQLAVTVNGRVLNNNDGQTIWDKTAYWGFNGEASIGKYDNLYDAIKHTDNLLGGRVFTQYGTEILNNSINFKRAIGVTNTSGLNFREAPSTSSKVISVLSDGVMVEILGKNSEFYQIRLYKKDGTFTLGYVHQLYLDIIQDDNVESNFGYIAAKYESNFKVGAISDNPQDKGGPSFGMFQLAKNGSLGAFMIWLQSENNYIYTILNNAKVADSDSYGTNYKAAWKSIAINNYEEFFRVQLKFVKGQYYDQFLRICKNNGYDPGVLLSYYSTKNMIFSTSIQHGANGAFNIISSVDKNVSIKDFITNVYDNRLNQISQSYPIDSDIYIGVKKRYISESGDIKRSYDREISY